MAPLSVTFSDLEGHVCCLKHLYQHTLGNIACIIYDMFTHDSHECARGMCTRLVNTTIFENEGLRKVTASHVHCGNISETVRDSVVVTTDQ